MQTQNNEADITPISIILHHIYYPVTLTFNLSSSNEEI